MERKMRKILFTLTMALCVAALVSAASSLAKNLNNQTAPETIVGYISDDHCGSKHQDGSEKSKSCVLGCIKRGAKFVLVNDNVYELDQTGQDKASELAGEQVKVTGSVSGESISVTSIERE
jgi:hypothetical protein